MCVEPKINEAIDIFSHKKVVQIGTGSSKLPIAHSKMADFGERKENCPFSGLAA